jgi:hypothetical protein
MFGLESSFPVLFRKACLALAHRIPNWNPARSKVRPREHNENFEKPQELNGWSEKFKNQ